MEDKARNGWIIGLAIVPASWVAAGVVSTVLPEPETAFPWVLLGAFVLGVVGLGVMTHRTPVLRRTAWLGAAVSVLVALTLLAVVVAVSP